MKKIILIICVLAFASCSLDKKGGLEEDVQTLKLTYVAWACDCAKWSTAEDLKKFSGGTSDYLIGSSVFIEPANQSLKLPETLGYNNDVIRFTGQFYHKKGFPEDYESYENPQEARVFRYTTYEIVESHYIK